MSSMMGANVEIDFPKMRGERGEREREKAYESKRANVPDSPP
jgi:hypothetical protein